MSKIDGMTPKQAAIVMVIEFIQDAIDEVEPHLNRGKVGKPMERGIRTELAKIHNRQRARLTAGFDHISLIDIDNLN